VRPDVFLPDLAGSLHNLGLRLSELGRREQALVVKTEALSIIWPFFERLPAAFAKNTGIMLGSYPQLLEGAPPPDDIAEKISRFEAIMRRGGSAKEGSRRAAARKLRRGAGGLSAIGGAAIVPATARATADERDQPVRQASKKKRKLSQKQRQAIVKKRKQESRGKLVAFLMLVGLALRLLLVMKLLLSGAE